MKGKWVKKRIDQIGAIFPGGTPSTSNEAFWGGHIPFVTPPDLRDIKQVFIVKTERFISDLGVQKSAAILLPEKSIVISTRAPIGYLGVTSSPSVTNQGCKSLVVSEGENPVFHFYNLQLYVDTMKRYGVGTTFAEISKKDLSRIVVSFPSESADQQHIVDILSNCDEVIEQTEKAIAKYRDIKAGMLHDLFTRGLDANGRLRPRPEDTPNLYKDSPLGKIPKEWEILTVDFLFDLEVGGDLQVDSFSPHRSNLYQYPVFSNSLEDAGLYGYTSVPCYPSNSITITGRGSLGHAEYRQEPFDAIIRLIVLKIRDRDSINCKLVVEQLNFDHDFFVENTGVPQLTSPQAAKMRIRVPHLLKEQDMIVNRLSSIDAQIEAEEQTLKKYRSIKLGLMKRLLTPPEGALEA